MINDRKVIEKGAGLTNMSRGRGMASLQSERTPTGNFGRLAQSLGVGIQAVKEKHQERADIEAMNAYKKAQHSTIGKSPEEQRKALSEARAGIKSGESLSFFDRLLTDESQSVQVWDKLQAKSMGKKAMASADRFRAENQNLNEYEMKQGIANILQGGLQEAKGISEFAGNQYMQHSSAYIDNLDQTLTKQFVAKRRSEMIDGITTDTADELNSFYMSITGLTKDDILKGSESLDSHKKLKDAQSSHSAEALTGPILEKLEAQVDNLVRSDVMSPKEARDQSLNALESFALRSGRLDVFDEVVTAKQKGSGNTMMKANPTAVQEARERVAMKLESRRRTMVSSKKMQDTEASIKMETELSNNFRSLADKATGPNASSEDIVALNKMVQDTKENNQKLLDSKEISGVQFKSLTALTDSWEFEDRAKRVISRPEVVQEAKAKLINLQGRTISEEEAQWANRYAEHMDPEQAKEFADLMDTAHKNKSYTERVQGNLRARADAMHEQGLKPRAQQSIFLGIDPRSVERIKKLSSPEVASKEGVGLPPNTNEDIIHARVMENVMANMDSEIAHTNKHYMREMWETEYKKVTDDLNKQMHEYLKSIPLEKDKNFEVSQVEDIEDPDEKIDAIVKRMNSYSRDPDKRSKADAEEIEEMEPLVVEAILEQDFPSKRALIDYATSKINSKDVIRTVGNRWDEVKDRMDGDKAEERSKAYISARHSQRRAQRGNVQRHTPNPGRVSVAKEKLKNLKAMSDLDVAGRLQISELEGFIKDGYSLNPFLESELDRWLPKEASKPQRSTKRNKQQRPPLLDQLRDLKDDWSNLTK